MICGMHNDLFESKTCNDRMEYGEMRNTLDRWKEFKESNKNEAGAKQ